MKTVVPLLLVLGSGAAQAQVATAQAKELHELRLELERVSARLNALERERGVACAAPGPRELPAATESMSLPIHGPSDLSVAAAPVAAGPDSEVPPPVSARSLADEAALEALGEITVNFGLDGYYSYNFNRPSDGVNTLRAYDISSNSFSINQASIVIERLPQAAPGKRAGGRIDLQFGQATETLQGSAVNELRPQVWRNLYQAYGSYLAPIGSGLQLDFGKFSSSLGVEGNYTKDQITYSRAYLFNYLPFYHTGLRASYTVSPKLNATYWLVNGAQQTEDFNGFKSQGFLITVKPASTLAWSINYYVGQEQRSTTAGGPASPSANGREHIFDTYATWAVTPKLTLVGEADYVLNRTFAESWPARVAAGALYAKYAVMPRSNIAIRMEYLDDRNGLFSGTSQALKEVTFVADRDVTQGFRVLLEYRHDLSNREFFPDAASAALRHGQSTAELGLVYWWGPKSGSW